MKKLLVACFVALCSFAANAGIIVPVYWGFSPSSNQSNILRAMIEHANKDQTKYTFVYINKQGAGGSIAVNEVLASQSPKIMMMSTSLFVRQKYYPNESYNLDEVQPITVVAKNAPLVLLSSKYKSISEMKTASSVSIGMINGSITEPTVNQFIKENSLKDVVLVPYKNSTDARIDAMSKVIDATIEFNADGIQWINEGKLFRLWETGKKGSEHLVANYYMFTNTKQTPAFVEEMNAIFSAVALDQDVISLWKDDKATVTKMSVKETNKFFDEQRKTWR